MVLSTPVFSKAVEYGAGFQTRAAEDVQALPDGSAVVDMLSDYAAMQEQVQACAVDWGGGLPVMHRGAFKKLPR
ncbi:MAG: hypothetical protein L3J36_06755 [Rhodobacteraceae bacterium]|nr:hypothetical protein [Paracoccaceae bacterium]